MGFWKDVAYDMQRGMSKQDAIRLNTDLKYGNLSKEEKVRLEAKVEADLKLNSMP